MDSQFLKELQEIINNDNFDKKRFEKKLFIIHNKIDEPKFKIEKNISFSIFNNKYTIEEWDQSCLQQDSSDAILLEEETKQLNDFFPLYTCYYFNYYYGNNYCICMVKK